LDLAIKVGPNDESNRLKVRLVAKGYTQIYGLHYSDTFTSVAEMTTFRLSLAMIVIHLWLFHQLDIKNAFLHGSLEQEVYMEQHLSLLLRGSLVWFVSCTTLSVV